LATTQRHAGDLKERVILQRRALDNNGDRLGPWETVSSGAADQGWAAQILRLKGGEPVMAQRLQGVQPALIAVRSGTTTRQVDNAWRAIEKRTGQIHDITSAIETPDRAWVEILTTAKAGEIAAL